jgi:hypothetical protein
MIRFLLSVLTTAASTMVFLRWSQAQVDAQFDKMQQKVHFTPGAEAPLPPPVALGGAGLLTLHLLLGRWLLRLRAWQSLLSLLFGMIAGLILFLNRTDTIAKE